MKHIKIKYKYLIWLDKHGGRDYKDLLMDNKGLYVEMFGRSIFKGLSTIKKIYLPK